MLQTVAWHRYITLYDTGTDNEIIEIMATPSMRISDDMTERLKNITKVRDISLNKLMFGLSSQGLAEEDAKQRFLAAQLRGDAKRALRLLDELDVLGL
jgi:hypothetical protein